VLTRCRNEHLEPPGRVDRLVASARATATDRFCAASVARLDHPTSWRGTAAPSSTPTHSVPAGAGTRPSFPERAPGRKVAALVRPDRAQVRDALGFRPATRADEEALAGWLAADVAPDEPSDDRLRETLGRSRPTARSPRTPRRPPTRPTASGSAISRACAGGTGSGWGTRSASGRRTGTPRAC
jgi:hypothetical protein